MYRRFLNNDDYLGIITPEALAQHKQAKLYLKDTAPTSDTMRLYRSGDVGATWQPIENGLEVSNAREDGVTIRTYDFDMTPGTAFKLEFDEQVTLCLLYTSGGTRTI